MTTFRRESLKPSRRRLKQPSEPIAGSPTVATPDRSGAGSKPVQACAPQAQRAPADDIPPCADVPSDLVVVGRISGSYGIRGWIRIEPHNRVQDSVLLAIRRWWWRKPAPRAAIGSRSGPGSGSGTAETTPAVLVEIASARVHGSVVVAKPLTIHDKEAAEALKGAHVLVSRADFPRGDPDEFYWTDLVGCEVINPSGQDLGRVFAVEDYGAHPVLRLRDANATERMIPFVAAHVLSVDLSEGRILADWQLDY